MSAEHLYELVNQTLLANFGPLGSYAITRRESSDNDDIFHTMLASSVAHNIVGNLIDYRAIALQPTTPVGGSFVSATSVFAASHALPPAPLGAETLPPLRVGSHAAPTSPAAPVAAVTPTATVSAAPAYVPDVVECAPAAAASPVAAAAAVATESLPIVPLPVSAVPVSAVPVSAVPASSVPASAVPASSVPASSVPASSVPVSAVPTSAVPASSVPASAVPASSVPASSVPVSLAPVVAVPVSADLAAALTELDQTGPIRTATLAAAPVATNTAPLPESADSHLVSSDR